MEVKVSLAETLKDWLSRKEMYSFSCNGFRRMAGVLLEDHFSNTDDIKGYAHIHSDSQQASEELKSSFFPPEQQDERRAPGESTNPHSAWEAEGRSGHTHVKVPITAEPCWPGGTSPCGAAHGTYRDSGSCTVRAAHGKERASGTESLRPGPAANLLIGHR